MSFEHGLHAFVKDNYSDFAKDINNNGNYDKKIDETYHEILKKYKELK